MAETGPAMTPLFIHTGWMNPGFLTSARNSGWVGTLPPQARNANAVVDLMRSIANLDVTFLSGIALTSCL
jgi:hypothetical protein